MPVTGTTTEYSSSRLVVRVPVGEDEHGKTIYANSTVIPRFAFSAATPDEVIELCNELKAIMDIPAGGKPVHVDAITTARFVNAGEGWAA